MMESFKAELDKQDKSKNTVEAYIRDTKQFKDWLVNTLGEDTDNITETDLKEYKQYLNLNLKLNVSSINRKLKSVALYQRFLYHSGICKTEIKVRDILQKNNIEPEAKIVEKQELYKLKRTIEAEGNKRDIAIYYLLFGTGARVQELVDLELDDINLTDRNGKNSYSFILIRAGKGDKSRKVNINCDVVNSIKEYLQVRPITKSYKLLQGQRGALTRLAINKILEKYSKQAGIDYIVTPHMARHTFCTNMIKNGTDVKTVSELAGHSSTDLTYKYYVNSSAEDKQKAVNGLKI